MNEIDGSYGTVKFIRKIDMAFDMLNSRNPCDTGAKKPVTNNNLDTWQKEALSLANFIFELKDSCGRLLRNSPRKTAIWGFTVSLRSNGRIKPAPAETSCSTIWIHLDI